VRLWRRAWRVDLGSLRIEGDSQTPSLDLNFNITKDVKRTPNSLELNIYNLSENHRQQIESADPLRVVVRAGYMTADSALFFGDVHVANSQRDRKRRRRIRKKHQKDQAVSSFEGPDIVTRIEAQDGGRGYSSMEIQKSYAANTALITVLRDLIAAMGIGEGNLATAGVPTTIYTEGTTVTGRAWRELDRLVRSAGLRWSVQDGALQLLRDQTPLRQTAIVLSPETGLIGSPAVDADGTIRL